MSALLQDAVLTPAARSAEEVAASLERILAAKEFQQGGVDPVAEALGRLFSWSISDEALVATGWTLLWIAAIGLGVGLGWLYVRMRASPRRAREATGAAAGEFSGAVASAGARALELRARAQAARASGDLALALRLALFALLVELAQRGDLEFRDAWTHRELFERGRPSAAARAALGPWLGELDAKLFGRAGVVAADLERLEGLSADLLSPRGVLAR